VTAVVDQLQDAGSAVLYQLGSEDLRDAIDDVETVVVKDMPGRHSVRLLGDGDCPRYAVSIDGKLHDIGGWEPVASTPKGCRWEAWTVEQVMAERLRRHSNQAFAHYYGEPDAEPA